MFEKMELYTCHLKMRKYSCETISLINFERRISYMRYHEKIFFKVNMFHKRPNLENKTVCTFKDIYE